MLALLVPAHSLAALATTRMLLAVLIGETSKLDSAYVEGSITVEPEWLASVIAGAYVHGRGPAHNVRAVMNALKNDADIVISIRTGRAIVEDIASRIGE